MGVVVVRDRFDRAAGTLTTPWTLKTGDVWTLDTDRVYASGTPSTFRRAILDSYSIYALLSGSPPTIAKRYEVEAQFIAPTVFSSTEDTYAGIEVVSPGANATGQRLEVAWKRTSADTQTVEIRVTTVTGAIFVTFASVAITSVAAGSVNTISAQVEIGSQGVGFVVVNCYFNGAQVGSQLIIAGTLGSFNYTTVPHYAGLVAYTPGPADSSGNPLYPILFDNFVITDNGTLATVAPIFPEPTLTAASTLTPISLSAEDNSTGSTLPFQPEEAFEVTESWLSNELRTTGGAVVTLSRASRCRRYWMLRFVLSASDLSTLKSTYDTLGMVTVLTWTQVDGTAIKIRFVSPLKTSRVGVDVFTAQVGVGEIYA